MDSNFLCSLDMLCKFAFFSKVNINVKFLKVEKKLKRDFDYNLYRIMEGRNDDALCITILVNSYVHNSSFINYHLCLQYQSLLSSKLYKKKKNKKTKTSHFFTTKENVN